MSAASGKPDGSTSRPGPAPATDSGNTTRTIQADLRNPDAPGVKPAPKPRVGLPTGGIPGFRIGRRIGAGGMGQVYEATRESDGRHVALKLMRADSVDDPEFRDRFDREAAVMQAVAHGNVVGYVGAGEHDGWLYLATELMRDGDLDRYLKRRGQLFERDALTLLLKAAEGIKAIHAAGLVHRDIKPQNIFLDLHAKDGGDVKVGDLGLARHESGEDRMTLTGTACGTPAYMAPEQLRGEADIDHRADTYALGVMLYTLLAGREPFVGDTAYTVSHAVLRDQAPDLRRFAPETTVATVAIVRQAMRKQRDERYQTIDDFITDCRRAMAGERPLHAGVVEEPVAVTTTRTTTPTATPGIGASAGAGAVGGIAEALSGMGPMVKVVIIGIVLVGGLSMLPGIMEGRSKTGAGTSTRPVPPQRDPQGLGVLVHAAGANFALRWCPPGSFTMGSPDSEPDRVYWENQRPVTLSSGFWMAQHEVTRGQWAAIMGLPLEGNPALPEVGLSRLQAEDFCLRLGQRLGLAVRLPTEAEWEYACRAGTQAPFAADPGLCILAHDDGLLDAWAIQLRDAHPNEEVLLLAVEAAQRRGLGPAPATTAMNAWGLVDCHGNVAEWCQDRWNHRVGWGEDAVRDPLVTEGPLTIVRGGSWIHPADRARSAARDAMDGDAGWPWIGLRFVIPAASPESLPSE